MEHLYKCVGFHMNFSNISCSNVIPDLMTKEQDYL